MPLASFELETDVIANRDHDVSGVALELVATAGNYASRVQDIACAFYLFIRAPQT